jgi:hypothetical protein
VSKLLAHADHSEWLEESGLSVDSTLLRSMLKKAREHASEPVSLGWKRQLHDQAMEIGEECSETGWDGYGAAAIPRESVIKAMYLVHQLPNSVKPPYLVPSPGGYISFEWHDSEKRVLSVSPKNDLLIWASVLGVDDTRYGRSPSRKGWPQAVLDILKDHFANG